MNRVVGFEGFWPDSSLVTWGAAVVCDDERYWNSLSRQWVARRNASEELGACTLFRKPLPIQEEHKESPLIVVAVRKNRTHAALFVPDVGRTDGCLGKRSEQGACFFVLANDEAFRQYKELVVSAIFKQIDPLRKSQREHELFDIASHAITLDSKEPRIHALRVFFAPEDKRSKVLKTAEASVNDRGKP